MAPAERRLSSSAANPTLHPAQLTSRDVLAGMPITTGIRVPVLVSQKRVGSMSQASGAAAGWLTALDPLPHKVDSLAVVSWDTQVPKWTERPPTDWSVTLPALSRHRHA